MFCNNTSGIPEAKIPVIIYIWSDLEPRELKGQVIFKVSNRKKKKKEEEEEEEKQNSSRASSIH